MAPLRLSINILIFATQFSIESGHVQAGSLSLEKLRLINAAAAADPNAPPDVPLMSGALSAPETPAGRPRRRIALINISPTPRSAVSSRAVSGLTVFPPASLTPAPRKVHRRAQTTSHSTFSLLFNVRN